MALLNVFAAGQPDRSQHRASRRVSHGSEPDMRDIVIFGTGQIAEVVHYYLTTEGNRNVVAFTVDEAYRKADELLGLPVVAFDSVLDRYNPNQYEMFVAMSFRRVNKDREDKVAAVEAMGYTLASHVSPDATVWKDFV